MPAIAYSPVYGFDTHLLSLFIPLLLVAAIWTIVLKGFALWFSARGGQKWWFIAILVINTLGVLEIIYLIWFRKQEKKLLESSPTPTGQ